MNEPSPPAVSPWSERGIAVALLAGALLPAARLGRAGLLMFAGLALVGLVAAGARVAPWLTGGGSRLDRGVATIVGVATALTLTATLLGHFGLLRRAPFWSLVAGLVFVASFLARAPRSPTKERQIGEGPAVATNWRWRIERALPAAAVVWLMLGLGGAIGAARLTPPGRLAFDDLSYHLSAVAVWWQSADLRMLKFAMGDPATAFYPLHGELLAWAELSLLAGSDFLARFAELPFALALLAAVAGITRRLGLSWPAALLAVALTGTLARIYPDLTLTAGNDVASAFFALAVFHAALLLRERVTPGRLVYAGLGVGLLVGTKYAGVLLLPVVGVVLAVGFVGGARREGRRLVLSSGLLVATAAAAGGYAYLRNLVTTGNPLFPAQVELFGHELLRGWPQATSASWRLRPEYPIEAWRFLLDNPGQLGALFAWVLLPAAFVAPVVALARGGRSVSGRLLESVLLAAPIGFYLVFLELFYDHRDVRYVLAGTAMAAIAAAWLGERIPGGWGSAARSLLALSTCFVFWTRFPLPAGVLAVVALLGAVVLAGEWVNRLLGPVAVRLKRLRSGWPGLLAASCALLAALGADVFATYERRRLENDRAAATVEALTRKREVTIAYAGWNQPYLFFGSGLRNRVRIVPTFADPAAEYYVWGGSTALPGDRADRQEWLANLRAANVELVVAGRARDEGPESGWMRELPDRFELWWSDGREEIWRFDRPAQKARGG